MFIGWNVAVFILLVNIFNHMFNLFINNIVREPIIDESLFYNPNLIEFILLSYIIFVIHPPLMMVQSWAESTWEIKLWKVYQPIPAKYHEINTAIWKDQ